MIAWYTTLNPHDLLSKTQHIEKRLGRTRKHWDIAREIDVDIIFYGNESIDTPDLQVPHPRYHERDFVLEPLKDIDPYREDPCTGNQISDIVPLYQTITNSYPFCQKVSKVVAVLNLSPDSFSDWREWSSNALHQRIQQLLLDGADVIDVGAESTAPWSEPISGKTEEERLRLLFNCMKKYLYPVTWSLDTTKSSIAELGIAYGFTIINDVSWGRLDSGMIPLIVSYPDIKYVVMYAKNASWRADLLESVHGDIIETIYQFFDGRIGYLIDSWIQRSQIIIDPGMWAFVSANYKDSLQILRKIWELKKKYTLPVFVCTSRKWFHAKVIADNGPQERIWSSLATSLYAIEQGVDYIRVHDVKYLNQAISILSELKCIKA